VRRAETSQECGVACLFNIVLTKRGFRVFPDHPSDPDQEALDMGDPKYLVDVKKHGAGDPTKDDIHALEHEMYNSPDRASAIVLGSLVEKAIEKLLRTNLRPQGINELFKHTGLLGDFSAKIQMGYALRLFGGQTRKDLNIIRTLRNQFAHSRRPIEFSTPVVKRCCDELTYPDAPGVHISFNYLNKVSDELLREAADNKHPRTRYFMSCNEIAQRVYFIRGADDSDPRNQFP
jgi:hypothetical protein